MRSPRFLAVLAFLATIVLPASGQSRPSTQAPPVPGVRALRNVEYARVDGNRPLYLDLYLPEKPAAPTPLVVWIHGGGWVGGSKNNCPPLSMVSKGFAAASVEYRFADVAPFPAQIHDCKGAIRFLRANAAKYNLDPNRIGAWGASAGGHLVALLGTGVAVKELDGNVGGNLEYSSRVQAVCD
jgi:acetyl esterase/lipase